MVEEFLNYFKENYKEFFEEPNSTSDEVIKNTFNEVVAIYPEVRGEINQKTKMIIAGYVVAHYISMSATSSTISGGSGNMLASATIGNISISTQSPPIRDMYEYFFGSTPYGIKFLAYLASVGGLKYVN